MRTLSNRFFAASGGPDKSGGGYAEPTPDPRRGDDAEDSFQPEYDQGREPKKAPAEPDHEKAPHDKS